MTTLSEIAEATYRSKFDDQVTGAASSAAAAMRSFGQSAEVVEQKVGRATKAAEQLKQKYLENERVTAALTARQRALAREVENIADEVRKGALTQEQASEMIANAIGKQEALLARQSNRIRREISDWQEAAQAAKSAQDQIALATVSRYRQVEAAAMRAAEMQRKAQEAVDRFVAGSSRGSGMDPFYQAQDARDRAADIAEYGRALDDLRSKFNPLFAVQLKFTQEVEAADHALSVGAISAKEYSAALVTLERQEELARAAVLRGNQALRERVEAERQATQNSLNSTIGVTLPSQGRSEQRAGDIAALGAALEQAAGKWAPLQVAAKQYADSLKEIRQLEATGFLSNSEAANAMTTAMIRLSDAEIAYGRALDEVRAKFNPLLDVQLRYARSVEQLENAYLQGRMGAKDYSAQLVTLAREEELARAAVLRGNQALRERAEAERALTQSSLHTTLGISMPDDIRSKSRQSDINELASSLERAAASWAPLQAAAAQYRESLQEIARLQTAGFLSDDEASNARATAMKRLTAAQDEAGRETRELAQELDKLRLQYVPLAAIEQRAVKAMEDIDRLRKAGRISAEEEASAISKVARAREDEVAAMNKRNGTDAAADLDRIRQKYDPLYAASVRYKESIEEIDKAEAGLAMTAEQASVARARQLAIYDDQVEALKRVEKGAIDVGNGVRLSSYQLLVLGQQANDIVATLLQGMSPSQVALQQLPQVIGVFNNLGDAMKAAAAQATLFRVGMAAAAVVVIGSAVGFERTQRALNEMSARLRETRSDYEQLTKAGDAASRVFGRTTGFSISQGREAATILANTQQFPRGSTQSQQEELLRLQYLAADVARVFGVDLPDAARRLAAALQSPEAAARRLVEGGFSGMNEEGLRTVQMLVAQGRGAEATAKVFEAYQKSVANARNQITPFQKSIEDFQNASLKLFDQFKPLLTLIGSETINVFTNVIRTISDSIEKINSLVESIKQLRDLVPTLDFGRVGDFASYLADRLPSLGPTAPLALLRRNRQAEQEPPPVRTRLDQVQDRTLSATREINPRAAQIETLRSQQQVLRSGLPVLEARTREPGLSPEQLQERTRSLREASDASRELSARLYGMRDAWTVAMTAAREETFILEAEEGARRTVIQAIVETDRALRAEGQAGLTVAQAQEVEEQTLNRLQVVRDNYIKTLNIQIEVSRRVAQAYTEGGAAAGQAMEDMARAEQVMRETAYYRGQESDDPNSEYQIGLQRVYEKLQLVRQGERDVAAARAGNQQQQQLDYLRREAELVGATADVRERELAALRERQAIIAAGDNPDSDQSQTRIANARAMSDMTRSIEQQRNSFQMLAESAEQSWNRIGSAITEAFTKGEMSSIKFGNIARAVASQVMQALLQMSTVNPILNMFDGGTRGTFSGLMGGGGLGSSGGLTPGGIGGAAVGGAQVVSSATAGGGAGGGGGLGGLTSMLGLSGSMSGIGSSINAWGASTFPSIFGMGAATAGTSGLTAASLGGPGGLAALEASGIGSTGVSSALAGTAPTLLGAAGGLAGGFALGSMAGGLIAGKSQARQQNAQIGAAGGAIIGLILTGGNPLGGIIGGLVGGAGGGMIGPGPKTNAFGFSVNASGGKFDAGGLRMTGDGAGGPQELAAAKAALKDINKRFEAAGVTVRDGSRVINGQTDSEDQSMSLASSVQAFRFESKDSRINTALKDKSFEDFESLFKVIDQAKTLADALDTVAKGTSAFQNSVNQLAKQYDEQIKIAQELGFGEKELSAERTKQINELYIERNKELESIRESMKVTEAAANGRTREAALIEQAANRTKAIDDMTKRLKDLGLSATESAAYVEALIRSLDAQAAAAERAVVEAKRTTVFGVDFRLKSLQVAAGGNANDAFALAQADAAERARVETNAFIDQLKALGFTQAEIAAQTAKLTQIHKLESEALKKAMDDRREAANRTLDDRYRAATVDMTKLDNQLAEFDRAAAVERTNVAREGLIELSALERVHAAERLKIIADFNKSAKEELTTLGGNIRQFIDALKTSDASGLSPQQQFQNAQAIFNRDLVLSRGGDRDALGRITSSATALLDTGRAMYASGSQFQALRDSILSSLETLPTVKSYDQLVYEELVKLGGKVTVEAVIQSELRLRQEVVSSLAGIEVTAASEAARAQAEKILSKLTGIATTIAVDPVATNLARATANMALAGIAGNVATITITPTVEDDVRRRANNTVSGIAGVVNSIAVSQTATDAAKAAATAAVSNIASAVTSIAVSNDTTEQAKLIIIGRLGRITSNIDTIVNATMAASAKDELLAKFGQVSTILKLVSDASGIPEQQRSVLFAGAEGIVRALTLQATNGTLTESQRLILEADVGVFTRQISNILSGTNSLTADQRSLLSAQSGVVAREVSNTLAGTTLLTADQAAILAARSGTVNRTINNSVTTEESVSVSRSIDDKLSGILSAINRGLLSLIAISQGGFASVAQSVAQNKYVTPGSALESAQLLPGSASSATEFVNTLYRSVLRREPDASGSAFYASQISTGAMSRGAVYDLLVRSLEAWTKGYTSQGLEAGGWVGNGVWNRDSVVAAYAGGGNIALAGGEYVVNAAMAARYSDILPMINSGSLGKGSDNAAEMELKALRRQIAQLNAQVSKLLSAAERAADATEDTAESNKSMARNDKLRSPAVGRLKGAV